MKSVVIRGKSVPVVVLVGILLASVATGVYAWVVTTNSLGSISLTVEHAEATITVGVLAIGSVGSGYDFEGTVEGTIEITWAYELDVEFDVTGLDDTEKAALTSLNVDIGEDLDDDDILDPEEVWGTIDCLAPVPFSVTLDEGIHDILVYAYGTAAYPETDVPIDFAVTATVSTPS
jgi:hypothetical protein